jgi:hypothetical protein
MEAQLVALLGTVDADVAVRALAKLAMQVTGGNLEDAAPLALDVLAAASLVSSASSSQLQMSNMRADAVVVATSLGTDSRTRAGADRSRTPHRSSKRRPPSCSPEKERVNHNDAEKFALVNAMAGSALPEESKLLDFCVLDSDNGLRYLMDAVERWCGEDGTLWVASPFLDGNISGINFFSSRARKRGTQLQIHISTRRNNFGMVLYVMSNADGDEFASLPNSSLYDTSTSHFKMFAYERTSQKGVAEVLVTSANLTSHHLSCDTAPPNFDAWVLLKIPTCQWRQHWSSISPRLVHSV